MRQLDLPRRPGWVGGVCAGIAEKLGIDPVIVRGIAVVAAVLGAPAFLLYSVGWLLLPDEDGRIHLEQLLRGVVDRAVIGIVGVFILSLLPVSQGFWYLGGDYLRDSSTAGAIGRALWAIVVIGIGIWLTVWLARRANRGNNEPTVMPATTDDRPETVPDAGTGVLFDDAAATTVALAPVEPPRPNSSAPEVEIAAWRERQALWKLEHDAWKTSQSETERERRTVRAAQVRARNAAAAAASAERRAIKRLANPRLRGAIVAISLGSALLAGGAAAVIASTTPLWIGHEAAAGFGVATIVIALAIAVAGAFRRRTGFLGFVSVLLIVATIVTAFLPRDGVVAAAESHSASTAIYRQEATN